MLKNRNKLIIIEELNIKDLEEDSMKFIIDGKKIKTLIDYLEEMTEKFELPKLNNKICNINGLSDWMRDLTWIDEKYGTKDIYYNGVTLKSAEEITFIIKNYRYVFNGNFEEFNHLIIESFVEEYLPYWENHEYEGFRKKFNVYLVENLIED